MQTIAFFWLKTTWTPIFFFFSSRRRHTRYIGDWSSDVCSSDLKRSETLHPKLLFLLVRRLVEAVGVEEQGRAVAEGDDVLFVARLGKDADGPAGGVEMHDLAAAADERWVVAGIDVAQYAGGRVEDAEEEGRILAAARHPEKQRVEPLKQPREIGLDWRRHPQCRLDARHD